MNSTMSELEHANLQPQDTEDEYLRKIWKQLEVGQNGFLTVAELAKVCEFIGMEEMDDQVRVVSTVCFSQWYTVKCFNFMGSNICCFSN